MTSPSPHAAGHPGAAGAVAVPAGSPATAVAPSTRSAPGSGSVAERVVDAVLAHPDVVRLSGGTFGTIATSLPGRRIVGVSLGDDTEATRVGVVLRLGAPVRPTAAALRRLVADETGVARVDVVVVDVEAPHETAPDLPASP